MKNGKTVQELAAELDRQSKAKIDIVAKPEWMKVSTERVVVNKKERGDTTVLHVNGSRSDGDFEILPLAHTQMAGRLDVPKKFYDRIRTDHPALYDNTVNTLMAEGQPRLIRTMDGRMRADLSDRYRVLDNDEAAEAILRGLQGHEVEIASCEVTDTRLYIKALTPRLTFDIPGHSKLCGAMIFTNSEVGASRLSAEIGIWMEVCTNLAIAPDGRFKKTHIGARLATDFMEGMEQFFSDETRRVSDLAFFKQFQDYVAAMFDPERFRKFVEQMKNARDEVIDVTPVEVVEVTKRQFKLTEGEGNSILMHLIQGKELSKFGLSNAITRASQDVTDYDRATDLERLGGTVLALPRKEWTALAAA